MVHINVAFKVPLSIFLILTSNPFHFVSGFDFFIINNKFALTENLSFGWMLFVIAGIVLSVLIYVSLRRYFAYYRRKRIRDKR